MKISEKDFLSLLNTLNFKNKTLVFDMDHTLLKEDISMLMMKEYGYFKEYNRLIKQSKTQEDIIKAYEFSVECFSRYKKKDLVVVLKKILIKNLYRECLVKVVEKASKEKGKIIIVSASWNFFVQQVVLNFQKIFQYPIFQYYGSTVKKNLSFEEKKHLLLKNNIIPYMVFGDSINDFPMMELSEYAVFVKNPKKKYKKIGQKILIMSL